MQWCNYICFISLNTVWLSWCIPVSKHGTSIFLVSIHTQVYIHASYFSILFFLMVFVCLFVVYGSTGFSLLWAFSSSRERGLLIVWLLLLRCTGCQAQRLGCPTACGVFPDWGSNPCPLTGTGFLTTGPPRWSCFSTHAQMDICFVSSYFLWWIVLLWACPACDFGWTCECVSAEGTPRIQMAGSEAMTMIKFNRCW